MKDELEEKVGKVKLMEDNQSDCNSIRKTKEKLNAVKLKLCKLRKNPAACIEIKVFAIKVVLKRNLESSSGEHFEQTELLL